MSKISVSGQQATKPAKGAGRPVGSNKEASLAKILLAARQLFAERGYSNTTFKEVARTAGMTHAALYAYYPSKLMLYQATCEHAQALLLPEYIAVIESSSTLKEQLRGIFGVATMAHDKDSSITGLLGAIPLEMHRNPELKALMLGQQNITIKVLSDAFEQAQHRGEISDRFPPEDLVIAIMGAAVGIVLFQYGLERSSLVDSMEVFIELIDARLFIK